MDIILENLGKRYGYDWIFKNIKLNFSSDNIYAVQGPNGSGKSTLLKILSGHLSPSEGSIIFSSDNSPISVNDIYKFISFSGPYIELINRFTLKELINFHFKFKPSQISTTQEIIQILELERAAEKQLDYFSSGMRQRVKLGLAILSETPILLLDEPGTNLDQNGLKWYQELLRNYSKNKLVVIASNEAGDFEQAKERINIMDFKNRRTKSA